MKKVMMVASLAVLCIAGLTSCESGPEKATRKFFEHMANGQTEEAGDYCTERTEQMLQFAGAMGGKKGGLNPNFKFKLVEERVEGKEAWVKFTDVAGKAQNDTTEAYLVKVDGDWKVDLAQKK